MDWKKVFLLAVLVGILTLAGLYFGIGRPVAYREFRAGDISSVVPQWVEKKYKKAKWEGWTFKGNLSLFRVLWERVDHPDLIYSVLLSKIKDYRYEFSLPLFQGGKYFLKKRRKGYKILVLFRTKNRIFWIDTVASSTMKKYKKVVDNFLINLRIKDKSISDEAKEEILRTDRQIPITFMQSEKIIFILVGGIFLLLLLIMIMVFKSYGRCPTEIDALICSSMSTLQEKTTFRNNINSCCACLKSESISVYSRGKLLFEVPLSGVDKKLLRKGKVKYEKYTLIINDFDKWRLYLPSFSEDPLL